MNDNQMYRVIAREPRLADQAAAQLQELIVSRTFTPGDRLPSERELGERLAVSRTVIREALRDLQAKGLVEIRSGAGVYVRAPSADLISELLGICLSHMDTGDVTYRHSLEMRRIVEIEMAGLAAERRDPADLATMRDLLDFMARNHNAPDEWAKADIGFHNAIAHASKNPLFPIVLRSIADVLMHGRMLAIRLPDTPKKSLYHHRRIYEAIEKGSVEGARLAMEAHLAEAEDTQYRALAAKAAEGASPP